MPEFPPLSLIFALSTKSPYFLSVTKNSFFLSCPTFVLPTISSPSIVKIVLSSGKTQPLKSLPLNNGLKPSSAAQRLEPERQGGE